MHKAWSDRNLAFSALFLLFACGGESHSVTPTAAKVEASASQESEGKAGAPAPSTSSTRAAGASRPASTSGAPATAQSQGAPNTSQSSKTMKEPGEVASKANGPTLFWLEIGGGTVTRSAADGSGAKVIASGAPLAAPDGVTVDPVGKHFFVLNMGNAIGGANTGSLVRYDLDGSNPQVIMKPGTKVDGITFNTGKQVAIDLQNHKLYLGDREGSKVWRCDYDGGNLEVLVSGHDINQIVGVGADPKARQFYFSDRNGKKLFRANMDMPEGKTHENRDDVELLYVDKRHSCLIMFQAIDAGGKDGTIRAVFEGVNPQGVNVVPFQAPTEEELAHDFLWRVHRHVPRLGQLTIFNRSHYEDVLVVRVHDLVPKERWQKRYRHIRDFEQMLVDEGTTIVKFFLHISKEEQRQRQQERIDNPAKQWKFNRGDLEERRRLRAKAIADGVWPPPGGPEQFTVQRTEIFLPAPFSPLS